jgi:hypothetical protein
VRILGPILSALPELKGREAGIDRTTPYVGVDSGATTIIERI